MSEPLQVPESEASRQATDAIGGYLYQLHQTVLAWLTLGADELLHVELAEDIAISDKGELRLTQVKRTAASLTLRSDGVVKLIASVWRFQTENPSRRVRGALLTTSRIGKEKRISFPGNIPGLIYWRTAARDTSDVEPIRRALLSLDLPEDMKAFVQDASPDELRTRIIQPIRWLDGGASQDQLQREVEERLVVFGSRQGVPAQASKNALNSLVGALLDCIRKPASSRYVTASDLLTIFQSKTYVTVPPGILEGLTIPQASSAFSEVQAATRDLVLVSLPPRVAPRTNEIHRLQSILVLEGTLWLHGSSGLGKSTLAVLLARSQSIAWRFADLRDMPEPALRSILSGLAASFHETGARGIILDDIPAEPSNALLFAIGQVARAVAAADAFLLITSTKAPAPTLSNQLDLANRAIIQVPYFTEADVADVVKLAGGDPSTWARSIFIFAGGHPQLVDARVAGLRKRGWNKNEILSDLIPMNNNNNDMEEQRKAVRSRLLQDLDSDATELLLRLSCLYGNFDRQMALVAANVHGPVPQAGLVFDFLVGPWIEQIGAERYRLSPLLKDSGSVGLALPLQNSVRSGILNHLLIQRPFPADQLFQVFLIAAQQNNRAALRWFAGAVLSASSSKPEKSQFKRLAQEISVFALWEVHEGLLLLPDDVELSSLLRFAQIRVAIANDDVDLASKLTLKALSTIQFVEDDTKLYFSVLIWATVLLEPRIPISPSRWLQMLLDFVATPIVNSLLARVRPTAGIGDLLLGASPDESLFIIRATALRGVEELGELIDALEKTPKAIRDRYIGAAARTNKSLHLVVSGSWLAEVKRPGFDARIAATKYHELSLSNTALDNSDLAVELLCTEAILLDEYAGDQEQALEVLRIAQEWFPNDYRLNRQRQRVFYRNNRHADALREFEKFYERTPTDRAIERVYTLREAGRSAAEIGELDKTRIFFEQALEAARPCGASMHAMIAGLSADCAILDFDAGKIESALFLMRRALIEADDLDPRAGLKESYVKRVHLAAILYMRGAAKDFPAARQVVVVGMCSDPAPQEWFRTQPQPQPTFVWYQLAELEAEVSDSRSTLIELRKRTKNSGLLPMEGMLVPRLVEAAIRRFEVDHFLEALEVYPRAAEIIPKFRGIRPIQPTRGQSDTDRIR